MEQMNVEYSDRISTKNTMTEISLYSNGLKQHKINKQPWHNYQYKPIANFTITHTGDAILLKYKVYESVVRSVNTAINSPVWEDSCVEFFILFDDRGYYNFEFSCIGTTLVGFGKNREERVLLSAAIVSKIKCQSVFVENNEKGIGWELTIIIPVEVFIHHSIFSLSGKQCKANFYKCGDLLPQPHFLAWNDIQHPEPNFHLTEYFGVLSFE